MKKKVKKTIKALALSGLLTDGGHHKQWYLEEILKALGYDLKDLRENKTIRVMIGKKV